MTAKEGKFEGKASVTIKHISFGDPEAETLGLRNYLTNMLGYPEGSWQVVNSAKIGNYISITYIINQPIVKLKTIK